MKNELLLLETGGQLHIYSLLWVGISYYLHNLKLTPQDQTLYHVIGLLILIMPLRQQHHLLIFWLYLGREFIYLYLAYE